MRGLAIKIKPRKKESVICGASIMLLLRRKQKASEAIASKAITRDVMNGDKLPEKGQICQTIKK